MCVEVVASCIQFDRFPPTFIISVNRDDTVKDVFGKINDIIHNRKIFSEIFAGKQVIKIFAINEEWGPDKLSTKVSETKIINLEARILFETH